jgi:hypothetical protein
MAMNPKYLEERKAFRKRERELSKLTSVAHSVKVLNEDTLFLAVDGVQICGPVDAFNTTIEKLGYLPVRITRNLLNPQAGPLVVDVNTPSYCDVGSEAYWSM